MNIFKKLLTKINRFQQRHGFFGFPYAVIKKYSDDESSYEAALITYYGFLSLFPLLLVFTTVMQLILKDNPDLLHRVTEAVSAYFPVIGDQLQKSIQGGLGKTGWALIVGGILTLYGARGGADAFRHALNHVWQVPYVKRTGFPWSLVKSFGLIVVGGLGLLGAAIISGYATASGHDWLFRIGFFALTLVVLYGVFLFLFRFGLSVKRPLHNFMVGAAVGAVGLLILQAIGGYVLTNQLKHFNSLYGTFAIVLGLLFWIYLQAQVMLYAMEIDSVRVMKLWPRSLNNEDLTEADKSAYKKYAFKNRFQPAEDVDVEFNQSPTENK
jgi:YihY family inner membrane protein